MERKNFPKSRTAGTGRRRIVIATLGTYGDVNPYVGLAIGLRARGYEPVIATSPFYREYIESEGIAFHPVRPNLDLNDRALVARMMAPYRGLEFSMRELLLPNLQGMHDDLVAIVKDADLLVTQPAALAGPIVAEARGIPWVSTALAPLSFFSAHDFPVLPFIPFAKALERLPGAVRLLKRLAKTMAQPLMAPVQRLRAECGLPPGGNPLFEGSHSPLLELALFSRVLAQPQPDWPTSVRITGPILYNGPSQHQLSDELTSFLQSGPPPIIFTLGSAAVSVAGNFYEESAAAAYRLGIRAVLLIGRHPENRPRSPLPAGVIAVDHAPHAALFPHAAAIVHQGGAGTLHQALHAGRPMIIVPHAFDQPDHAHRVVRLGSGLVLYPNRYTASRATAELRRLLDEPLYTARAAEIAVQVRTEDGVAAACHAIETQLVTGSDTARAAV